MAKETAILERTNELPVTRPMLPVKEILALAAKVGEQLTGLIVPLLVLVLWDTAIRLHWVKPVFLPPPTTVLTTFYDLLVNGQFLLDLWVSIFTVVHGFLWGGVLGLLFGTAAGLSRMVERLFGPILNGIRQVPAIAWLPLIIMWVGIGDTGKLVVIAKSVFFPVFLNTLQGIRNVSREYVEVARVYEFTRFQLLRRVVFPAALPTIFVGIRFGAGISWAMIVAAEMLSGRKGLGFLLLQAQDLLMTDQVFVVIVVIGLVGYLIDLLLKRVERRLVRWKHSAL
jgi:sulfonate transport system permease protein